MMKLFLRILSMGIEMLKIFIDGEKVSRFPGIGWAVFLWAFNRC